MRSSDRSWTTACRQSIACPACRAIICSTPCSTPATRCASCIRGTSRAPPIWRSAPRSRPASPRSIPWCQARASSTARRRSPPPIRPARRVLALIGQIPSRAIGKGHGLLHEIPDQIGILRTLTKWAERVGTPAGGAGAWSAAPSSSCNSGRPRPVGIEVPPDVLAAKAEVDSSDPLAPEPEPPLDEDAIERAAELLAKAENPVIFIGGGAQRSSRGGARAGRTAHRAGRLLSARQGRARRAPSARARASPGGHRLCEDADVVLAVGTRMQIPISAWGVDDKLTIIKVDIDPAEMERLRKPEIGLVGACRARARAPHRASAQALADARRTVAASRKLQDEVECRNGGARAADRLSRARSATCCPTTACSSMS